MKRGARPVPRLGPPRETVEAPRRSSMAQMRHRLHRVTVTCLFVFALGFTLLASTGTSQHATAATTDIPGVDACDFLPSQNENWDPDQPGAGADGFLYPSEYIHSGAAATPLEKYGFRGLTWSRTAYSGDVDGLAGDDDQNCPIMAPIQNMLAQQVLDVSQSVGSVTISIRQRATDASPFMEMLRDAAPNTDTALQMFFAAAALMVVLTGAWMALKSSATTGGDRRSIISGVVWAFAAILVVGWMMMPTDMANGRDGSDCEGQECNMEAADGTAGADGVPEGETPIRSSDPNYYAVTAKVNDTGNDIANAFTRVFSADTTSTVCSQVQDEKDAGTRTLDCVLWYEMGFRPWAVGQFGGIGESEIDWTNPEDRDPEPPDEVVDGMEESAGATQDSESHAEAEVPEEGDDVRMMMLAAQAFTWQEASATGMARDANGVVVGGGEYTGSGDRITPDDEAEDHEVWDVTTKNGSWNQVRAYMAGEQPRSYDAWSGQEAVSDRTSAAFLSLIGNLLIAVFVLFTSLLTLMWFAVIVLALLMLPMVGLVSIFPPAQKLLRGLGELWMKGLILTIAFTVLQVIVGSITGTVMASNAAFGWKVVLLLAAVLGLFKVVKLAREDAFTPNLNSQGTAQSMDPDKGLNKVSPVAAGAGFAAGRGAARVAGRGAKAGGRAAGRGAKAGGAKVAKGAEKGAEKGKVAAHRGAVRARGSRPGQWLGDVGDSMHGWSADTVREADRKVSRFNDAVTPGSRRAATEFIKREDKREAREEARAGRKAADAEELADMRAETERKKWRKKQDRSRLSGRPLQGPEPPPPASERVKAKEQSKQKDEVEVDVAPPPSNPRVTRVRNKRRTKGGGDSGALEETKRTTKRSGGGQPQPGQQHQRHELGSDRRTSQPKVERRKKQGTRLTREERTRLSKETAREVAKNEQSKADRDAVRGGGRGGGRA